LDGGNFGFVNRDWSSSDSDHVDNARDRKNWEPIQYVKLAEHVPGEKRELDFFKPIRPTISGLVKWQKRLITSGVQV